MKLHPSLLTDSVDQYQQQLELILSSQLIEVAQVDVIDGHFADNITLTPADLVNFDYGQLQLDFHLMTEEPMDYVYELIEHQDLLPVRAVIAQVERMSSQSNFLTEVKAHSWQAGLSLDLYTPVEAIDKKSWDKLDIVQLMTIEAGFQGQEFKSQALDKIAQIRQLANKNIQIIVDGGVKKKSMSLLVKKGVDGVVVGSGLWKTSNPAKMIREYSELLN